MRSRCLQLSLQSPSQQRRPSPWPRSQPRLPDRHFISQRPRQSLASERRQKYDSWPFRLHYRGCLRPSPLVREGEGTRGSWLHAQRGWRSLRGVCSRGLASKPPSGALVVQGRTGCSAPCSAHPPRVLLSTPGCKSRPGSAGGRTRSKGCPPLPPLVHISLWLEKSSLSILAAKTCSWPRGNGALRPCGSGSRCWKCSSSPLATLQALQPHRNYSVAATQELLHGAGTVAAELPPPVHSPGLASPRTPGTLLQGLWG